MSNAESFVLTVDYNRTVEEMVKAGQYNWSDKKISSTNYPIPMEKTKTSEVIQIKLFNFLKLMSSAQIIQAMEREGYRPASVHEIIHFGEYAHKMELQRKHQIVALGSVWKYSLYNCVVMIMGNGAIRELDFDNFDGLWDIGHSFLGVLKEVT